MSGCWVCSEPETVYTDALGMEWCELDYNEIYLGET